MVYSSTEYVAPTGIPSPAPGTVGWPLWPGPAGERSEIGATTMATEPDLP